ncbi:hypothetical protein BDB00DRAFT_962183 [Zychaea mexicana]|uniref:uncharacterized protein n=1 Tax=Zychaea mexicana TaxID=64656 RepID=UPI0022FEF35B|nr:uncharacterized protein BDB00DRAFT_962183 [Zychaea mexicana]KAI9489591.1 hypothetical protein BDB00DRAFT_962183 [Zychaea mexicana]
MAHKGTEKTLQKLKDSVSNGNYYEAHQMYRTVARRYNKQQKYTKAIHLLHDGAVSLMQHEQFASGSDLANYMLDTYNLGAVTVDEKSLDRVVELLSLYPSDEPGRKMYIHNAFSWTQKHGEYREGDPELHDYVGTMFFHEERYAPAEEHLLVGTDHSAETLGKVAASWAQVENATSPGLFIARVVFQLLAMKNVHHATLAYTQFIEEANPATTGTEAKVRRAPADEPETEPVYSDSWLNFARLVLLTVQRDAVDLFRQLRESYKPMCQEQKGFDELLDDIGEVFFNIPRPRKQGNMLQDLMSSLFAGGPPQQQRQQITASRQGGMELD